MMLQCVLAIVAASLLMVDIGMYEIYNFSTYITTYSINSPEGIAEMHSGRFFLK